MFRPTSVVLPIAVMALAIVYYLVLVNYSVNTYQRKFDRSRRQVACTEEAKICPDGSAVGRTGPNCEFADCPITKTNSPITNNTAVNQNNNPVNTNTTQVACAADVRSCSDGSFVQRVPPTCQFASCPDSATSFCTDDDECVPSCGSCFLDTGGPLPECPTSAGELCRCVNKQCVHFQQPQI